MSGMVFRLALVVLVVAVPVIVVRLAQRRAGPVRATSALQPGVTLFAAPDCRLCGPARESLRRAGAEPEVIVPPHDAFDELRIRSVPTAVVVDTRGRLLHRRTGAAVAADAAMLAQAAGFAAGPRTGFSPRTSSCRERR